MQLINLSIVVPTRNRHATLTVIVDQFLSWSSQAFELVVEDNSDDLGAFAVVLERHSGDPRLRYHFHPASRSMVDNCEAAVARARGQVLSLIGDDDSVTQQCIEVARWMVEQDVEALVCGVAHYTWPDMVHAVSINQGYNGKLILPEVVGITRPVDVAAEFRALARTGAQRLGLVPRLYHSLVQKKLLDRAAADTGVCFPGPVPDMSNAVALAKHVKNCFFTDVPLVVSGQSRNSMSGRNSVRQHQGEIRKERSLPAHTADMWDPCIPHYWSGPTVWAEAAVKAAEATKQQQFRSDFSFASVYAACFIYNDRTYYPLIFKAMLHGGWGRALAMSPSLLWHLGSTAVRRARTLLKKIFFGFPEELFPDVAKATAKLEQFIEQQKLVDKILRETKG
jgi:hypothetical protein